MKQGIHEQACEIVYPNCLCNHCQRDCVDEADASCCEKIHGRKYRCPITECKFFIADEKPEKKKGSESNEP